MKRFKNLVIYVLSCALCFTYVSCQKVSALSTEDFSVWTASGNEKILADKDYSARYNEKVFTLSAFRNEYESSQIIISAKADANYTVEISDLTGPDNSILSAECFSVYKQMYVETIDNEGTPTGSGMYPDALLPYENAVQYGENSVKSGENSGLWITLQAPKEQKAGLYTGNFTVKIDETLVFSVPAKVTIFDYTLSDEVHSQSLFGMNLDDIAYGELDSTNEMMETYYDYLLDYRIQSGHFPTFSSSMSIPLADMDAIYDEWIAYADKYSRDERCSYYSLIYTGDDAVTLTWTDSNGAVQNQTITAISEVKFKELLRRMADHSLESERSAEPVNLFKKAGTYFAFFDEYDGFAGRDVVAIYNLQTIRRYCEEVADEYAVQYDSPTEFQQEVIDGIRYLKHKLVGTSTEGVESNTIEGLDHGLTESVFVAISNQYNSAESRQKYIDYANRCSYGGDLWIYTADNPDYPYANYHTENIQLAPRLLGWMMYDYQIKGNLYWGSVMNKLQDASGAMEYIQDYYNTAKRWYGANGDGYLLYSGRQYGVYGPVGTVRLHSIRDGNEDYDLLYALEDFYKNSAEEQVVPYARSGFASIMSLLSSDLYSGTMVSQSSEITESFAQSRKTLADLLALAQNTGIVIEEYRPSGNGAVFTISAPVDTEFFVNGETPIGSEKGERKIYHVNVPLNKDGGNFTLECSGYGVEFVLGAASRSEGALFLEETEIITGGNVSTEELTFENENIQALKIDYDASTEEYVSAEINVTGAGVTEEYETLTLNIYLYGEGTRMLRIFGKCTDSRVYLALSSVYALEPGWNSIVINVSDFGVAVSGMLEYMRLNLIGGDSCSLALGTLDLMG